MTDMTNNFNPDQLRGQPQNKGSWVANDNGMPEATLGASGVSGSVKERHSWATDEQAFRIARGTPDTTSATPVFNVDDEEGHATCQHCGEGLLPNLDAVRGRWGHSATEDTTCLSPELIASRAHSLREGAREWARSNPPEAARLNALSKNYEAEANRMFAEQNVAA